MAAYNPKQIAVLQEEKDTDPLARSYSGMTDEQLVTSFNALDRIDSRTSFSSGEIMESIDNDEFALLNAGEKSRVDRVLGLGAEVIIGPGSDHNALQELLNVFGVGSTTVANLSARRDVLISRMKELGLPEVSLSTVGRLV